MNTAAFSGRMVDLGKSGPVKVERIYSELRVQHSPRDFRVDFHGE